MEFVQLPSSSSKPTFLFLHHRKHVISTEAATVFVSGGVEKSAFLPLTTEPRSLVKAPSSVRIAQRQRRIS
jgi:hypothetical protein